jgi:hypothetical protein
MTGIINGALLTGYLTASLFFLRFWRDSQDRLFALFAAAFALLAVQRTALALTPESAASSLFYVLRLVAFLVIIAAIIDKNRRAV